MEQLNVYWAAWVEQVYHRRTHRGTGQAPLHRWMGGPSVLRPTPAPDVLAHAFLWTVIRTVTVTRSVSLHGNVYDVDADLVGRRVELRYDPTDLTTIDVWHNDRPAGTAIPAEIRRHVDPKLRNLELPEPGPPTGVAYLDALVADHAEQLRGQLSYQRPNDPDQEPKQP